MLDTLNALCSLRGVSGREENVREYIRRAVSPYADSISEDSIGNLIIFKKGKSERKEKLMLSAHMDEVGMLITEICKDGSLRFDFAGGVDRRVVLGKRVLCGENAIPGVIGVKPIHLTNRDERKNIPELSKLRIDIGCKSYDEAAKAVKPGDYVSFDSDFTYLSENRIKSRALDDRFGCAVLMTLIKEELLFDTYFAFTVQEEVGLRGAMTATYAVNPDIALVVESTTASDIPSASGADRVCALGNGAVIGLHDGGTIYNKELFSKLRDIAVSKGIKWQIKTKIAGGTDGAAIQRTRGGVRVTSVSLPTRYIHSPSCVADVRDIMSSLALVREFVNFKGDNSNERN